VLDACTSLLLDGQSAPLEERNRESLQEKFTGWSDQGYRVLGVAVKEVQPEPEYPVEAESGMTFAGFLLFFDPPKPDARKTIADLTNLGVTLKVITGDNRRVALHVAQSTGLPVTGVVTGANLNQMGDEALWRQADQANLFVEVDPNQKERIILALRKTGHVVGYLGDGINDAPALHAADVGISVDAAVDVAKEAADFVLLEQGLDVLRQGIEQGRRTFANTLKYVFTTTSANFGNMFSMAGLSLFLPFLPLLPKQILLNNFLSDFPAITIAGDSVDPEMVDKPHRWDVTFIRNFMIVFGLISSAFDYLTFGILLLVLRVGEDSFRTGWFIESLFTELFILLVVRTRRPLFKSRPGRWLWISTLLVGIAALVLPYLPDMGPIFGFVPLPPLMMILLLGITLLYVAVNEVAKQIFFRRAKY
jgi:P-type Mg2+ transporter